MLFRSRCHAEKKVPSEVEVADEAMRALAVGEEEEEEEATSTTPERTSATGQTSFRLQVHPPCVQSHKVSYILHCLRNTSTNCHRRIFHEI